MLAADLDQVTIMNIDTDRQRLQQELLGQVTCIAMYNWLYDEESDRLPSASLFPRPG